ncbi:LacI family DNA-binding transcriptional regulator [Streptomyces sp. NBC_00859]|uniref:LacI family DNA-binding transcriptional regulator n=1 Tax=Streptomyces sp. NBC_00859 TaxID=2903682 RepID=UPI00386E183A|nr:LacI family transcriptional regulator [Streptomyces sp. NBC_00859]
MAGRTPRQTPTMSDVARHAGVSVSTVSHVLNKTRPVADATARAVLDAVAHTGYVPDAVARALDNSGYGTIGLAMSALSNPYFSNVVHGIDRHASAAGYSLLLADTHDVHDREVKAVSELLRRRVSAIILAPSGDGSTAIHYARQVDIPIIVIDRFVAAPVDQIAVDNVEPTAVLVEHLASLGHTRIAMLTGRKGLSTTTERLAGYRTGLARNGIGPDASLEADGDSTEDGAAQAVRRLLNLPRPPSAIVAGNNRMTIGSMRALRDAGLSVPADMALVSFDDFEWADLFQPRLTAIAQPALSIGEQAVEMALARIRDPELAPRKVTINPAFTHRESCGCPSRTG